MNEIFSKVIGVLTNPRTGAFVKGTFKAAAATGVGMGVLAGVSALGKVVKSLVTKKVV